MEGYVERTPRQRGNQYGEERYYRPRNRSPEMSWEEKRRKQSRELIDDESRYQNRREYDRGHYRRDSPPQERRSYERHENQYDRQMRNSREYERSEEEHYMSPNNRRSHDNKHPIKGEKQSPKRNNNSAGGLFSGLGQYDREKKNKSYYDPTIPSINPRHHSAEVGTRGNTLNNRLSYNQVYDSTKKKDPIYNGGVSGGLFSGLGHNEHPNARRIRNNFWDVEEQDRKAKIEYEQTFAKAERYRGELEQQVWEKKMRDKQEKERLEQEELRFERQLEKDVPIWKLPIIDSHNEKSIDAIVRVGNKLSESSELLQKQRKLDEQRQYQEDLRKQAEEEKQRKLAQKKKEEEEDLKYENQFAPKGQQVVTKTTPSAPVQAAPIQPQGTQLIIAQPKISELTKISDGTLIVDVPSEPFIPTARKSPKVAVNDPEIVKWRRKRRYSSSDEEEEQKRWSKSFKTRDDEELIKDTLKQVISQVKIEFDDLKKQLMSVKEADDAEREHKHYEQPRAVHFPPEVEESSHLATESTFLYPHQQEDEEIENQKRSLRVMNEQRTMTIAKLVSPVVLSSSLPNLKKKVKTPRTPEASWNHETLEMDDGDIEAMFKENQSKLDMLSRIDRINVTEKERIRLLNEYLNAK